MKQPDASDYVVGIAGCGAMGQGIAQVSVQGGMRTLLFDAREGGAAAAKDQIAGRIERLVEKGRIGEDDAKAAIDASLLSRLRVQGGKPSECLRTLLLSSRTMHDGQNL